MLLLVDNYDSFVYNIIHFLGLEPDQFEVIRNDEIDVNSIGTHYDSVIISPGPMTPSEAGCSNEIIRKYYKKIPILGICLGMECIGAVFGAELKQCERIKHGKSDIVELYKSKLFTGLPLHIEAARYHSLYISSDNLNERIVVNARLKDGMIMGIEHCDYPLYGVQFHPESILTGENGKKILGNFLRIRDEWGRRNEQ